MADATNGTTQIDGYRVQDTTSLYTPAAKSKDLGKNEFMRLLVTQLENQDPMQPMQDQQFVAQLATFSSLEQLTDMNKRMESMISGQTQLINSQSMSLVGKDVLAETGGNFQLKADGSEKIFANFKGAAQSGTLEIFTENGTKVRTVKLTDINAGRRILTWDGKKDDGATLSPGNYKYKITAVDFKGQTQTVSSTVLVPVDGINIGNGVQITSGNRTIDLSKVQEIRVHDTSQGN